MKMFRILLVSFYIMLYCFAPAVSQQIVGTTNITCYGRNDGTVTLNVPEPIQLWRYQIDDIGEGRPWYEFNSQTITITGLSEGEHTIAFIFILFPLPIIESFYLEEPTEIIGNIVSQSNVSCKGGNDGSVIVGANGGTPPYSFSIDFGNFDNTSGEFLGLTAGYHIVQIRDANGCETGGLPPFGSTIYLEISEPENSLGIDFIAFRSINCFGDNDGSITVEAYGGTPPYSYSMDGINFENSSGFFGNLSGGIHEVFAKDYNGCFISQLFDIEEPSEPLTTNLVRKNDVTCFNGHDGSFQVSAQGGTPPYRYRLSISPQGNSTGIFTNLSAQNFLVYVKDDNACLTTIYVRIQEPEELNVNLVEQTDVKCHGEATGMIKVQSAGGVTPYLYSIDGINFNNLSGEFNNLQAGNYTISVKDGHGCISDLMVPVNEPEVLDGILISKSDIKCFGGSTGNLTVAGAGGTSPYFYSIDGIDFSNTTGVFNNLSANLYNVQIKDGNDCFAIKQVNLTEPEELSLGIVYVGEVTCHGSPTGMIVAIGSGGVEPYTYSLDGWDFSNTSGQFTGLYASNYRITTRDRNGCIDYKEVFVTEPDLLIGYIESQTNVDCNGNSNGSVRINAIGGIPPYEYSMIEYENISASGLFTDLSAGNYLISIRDANGCLAYVNVSITEPEILNSFIKGKINVDCYGNSSGSLEIDASGGTPPYYYSLDGTDFTNTTGNFSSLNANTYNIIVRDNNNCTYYLQVEISQPDLLQADAGSDQNVIYGYGSNCTYLTGIASGGTEPYAYSWTGGTNPEDEYTINVCPTISTKYLLTVTDFNSCTAEDEVEINVNDIRCGNNYDKVLVCHNGNTICISPSAVPAHLNHGDMLGPCNTAKQGEPAQAIDSEYSLEENYPNPFSYTTVIEFNIPTGGYLKLNIYDIYFNKIASLVNMNYPAGRSSIRFDGSNLPSGIYTYILSINGVHISRNMIILK